MKRLPWASRLPWALLLLLRAWGREEEAEEPEW